MGQKRCQKGSSPSQTVYCHNRHWSNFANSALCRFNCLLICRSLPQHHITLRNIMGNTNLLWGYNYDALQHPIGNAPLKAANKTPCLSYSSLYQDESFIQTIQILAFIQISWQDSNNIQATIEEGFHKYCRNKMLTWNGKILTLTCKIREPTKVFFSSSKSISFMVNFSTCTRQKEEIESMFQAIPQWRKECTTDEIFLARK